VALWVETGTGRPLPIIDSVGPGHRERATLSYVTCRLFRMEIHLRAQSVIAQTIIGHGPQCNLSIS
jgi:hypothetical protein